MALDVLMSLHLVAEERGLTQEHPLTGRLIFALEKAGLRLPDLLIAENRDYGHYLREKYRLPNNRFRYLTHGADDRVFFPRDRSPPRDVFRVSYHGTYVVSHGLDTIVDAAKLLGVHPDIRFEFYGIGPEQERIEKLVRDYGLSNIRFHGHVPREELLDGLSQAHVCLGVFGATRQALFTIQNKLWEGLAMRRPVVSGDAPTVRAALRPGEEIYLVERGKPEALANAILDLKRNPERRERIARQGHQRFVAGSSVAAIGTQATEILKELANSECPKQSVESEHS